jgi:hypothetical protein
MAVGVEEVTPGLLVLQVGTDAMTPGAPLAYQLGQLYVAYGGALSQGEHVVIELWQGSQKVGEYGGTGLLLQAQ